MLRGREKIKVLIVDDSAVVREMLSGIINSDPNMEVVGTASDPYFARDKIKKLDPDVLTLDVEMPRMDGLSFLRKLMQAHPMPVIMVSSKTQGNCRATIQALELGAVDFIAKPVLSGTKGLQSIRELILTKIRTATQARVKRRSVTPPSLVSTPSYSADVILKREKILNPNIKKPPIIVMGASTGGTLAIETILKSLQTPVCGIAIVQHMPADFTQAFASRVNELCKIQVREARDGDHLEDNLALIAPGGKHMILKRNSRGYLVQIKDGQLVNRHKPSVDVLFRSAANSAGPGAIGVILTGMGDDGAMGLTEMHQAGAYTIAQDEKSCVVFGMPKSAIKKGGVDAVVPLHRIQNTIVSRLGA